MVLMAQPRWQHLMQLLNLAGVASDLYLHLQVCATEGENWRCL